MKIVKVNQKPQSTLYTPVSSFMDELFNYPLTRWDDLFMKEWENLSADIWEEDNNLFVKMAMPGIKKEDIKISVTADSLTVEGNSKEETEKKDKKYFLKTFQTSSYSQSFNLPTTVNPDAVEAKFEDGVLTVRLPKAKETQAKQITIK